MYRNETQAAQATAASNIPLLIGLTLNHLIFGLHRIVSIIIQWNAEAVKCAD